MSITYQDGNWPVSDVTLKSVTSPDLKIKGSPIADVVFIEILGASALFSAREIISAILAVCPSALDKR